MIRFFVKRLPTKFSLCHLLSVDQQPLSAGNRWMSWAWLTGLISSNFYKIALWYFYYTCKDTARDRYLLFSTFCWRSCPVSPWCYSVYDITCDWTTSAPTGSLLEPGMWYRIEISTSLWQYLYNLSPDSAVLLTGVLSCLPELCLLFTEATVMHTAQSDGQQANHSF